MVQVRKIEFLFIKERTSIIYISEVNKNFKLVKNRNNMGISA